VGRPRALHRHANSELRRPGAPRRKLAERLFSGFPGRSARLSRCDERHPDRRAFDSGNIEVCSVSAHRTPAAFPRTTSPTSTSGSISASPARRGASSSSRSATSTARPIPTAGPATAPACPRTAATGAAPRPRSPRTRTAAR
jgi:hypothetical protein